MKANTTGAAARPVRAALRRFVAPALAASLAAACSSAHYGAQEVWLEDYRDRHPIRVAHDPYGRAHAMTNPCGDWSSNGPVSFANRSHPNFGCAYQRNLAAQVADPRDLVAPRATTPPSATRRQAVIEAYGRGESTTTQYPDSGVGISEVGN